MKINQVSVFIENKPGNIATVCRTLADAGISIITFSMSDTQQFGILHLIVAEYNQAYETLKSAGFPVRLDDVVVVEIHEKIGGLADVLDVLAKKSVNIEYMYAFTFRTSNIAMMVFRFDDTDHAIRVLNDQKIGITDWETLCDRHKNATK